MTAYYDLTINEFFDKVYKLWESGGNGYLRDKAQPASGKGKSSVEGTIYTVFWSLLKLADTEKIDNAVETNNIDRPVTIFYRMIHDGCKVQISDIHQKNPTTPMDFFSSTKADTFRDKFKNKVDGNTKIKEALEKIEEYIEKKEGADKRKKFNEVRRRMFDETNVGDEKVSTHNYKAYKVEIMEAINNGTKQIILTGAPGTGKTRMAKEIAKELVKENKIVKDRIKEETEGLSDEDKKKDKENEIVNEYIQFVQFHPSYDYTDFVEGLRPVQVKDKDENGKSTIDFRRVDGIFKRFCRMVVEEHHPDQKYFFLIDEINRADLSKVFGELMYCLESDKRGEKNRVQTPYQNLDTYFPEHNTQTTGKNESANAGTADAGTGKKSQEQPGPDTQTTGETESANAGTADAIESKKSQKHKDVFKAGFYIPENVYIIGTMNDIDRSVESMDFALRRRFLWMEIEVTQPLLEGAFSSKTFWYDSNKDTTKDDRIKNERNDKAGKLEGDAQKLATRVMKMNEVISAYKNLGLNKQYYISQGQFANLPSNALDGDSDAVKALMDFVWEWRIRPLLHEYVRGEDAETEETFLGACEKALKTDDSTAQQAQANAPTAQQAQTTS